MPRYREMRHYARPLAAHLPIRTGSDDGQYIAELERELKAVQRSLAHALQRADQAERRATFYADNYVPRQAR